MDSIINIVTGHMALHVKIYRSLKFEQYGPLRNKHFSSLCFLHRLRELKVSFHSAYAAH